MTNQLQFLERADRVVLLGDGEVVAQGRYEELKEKGIDFSQYILKSDEEEEEERDGDESQEGKRKKQKVKKNQNRVKKEKEKSATTVKELEGSSESAAAQIMTEEEQATKAVSWTTYFRYFLALMHPILLVFFLFLTLLIEGCQSFANYWLGRIGALDQFDTIPFWWRISMYVLFGAAMVVLFLLRALWVGFAVRRMSKKVHIDLLNHVMKCPEVFFNTTPLGRILNRFSGDMTATDQQLFMFLSEVLAIWMQLIGNTVIVAIDTPFFLYFGLPVLLVFYLILIVFQRTSRNLQRIESISRSPVISLFGETVTGAGLSTIRAYHLEADWTKRFYALNDEWTLRFVLFKEAGKWGSMVASLVSTLFMLGVIVIGWFNMKPFELAVAINSGVAFGYLGEYLVRMAVELESNMTSLERIFFYSSKLPQEKERNNVKLADSWPEEGKIVFDHVSFRYRPGLPFVLNDISLTFNKGEKVGVCGRTGAGKSSLLFVLFRLIELDESLQPTMIDIRTGMPVEYTVDEPPNKGRVLIDGVDTSQIPLGRLRSSISIIPQDPVLFTGTVRYNLDIPGRWSDDRIWEVLDVIEMRASIMELSKGLDTQVAEGGSNFSCGQRQLLCFGRAILNNCRIVIMDEATASVDVETDAKIQNTIRNQFAAQTVIVIAHRLNTILGSDRILVMDAGRVAEFDTPRNLLANQDSAFNALLHSLTH